MNPFKIVVHVPPFLHGSLKQRLWRSRTQPPSVNVTLGTPETTGQKHSPIASHSESITSFPSGRGLALGQSQLAQSFPENLPTQSQM